jgi:hypothetical protein
MKRGSTIGSIAMVDTFWDGLQQKSNGFNLFRRHQGYRKPDAISSNIQKGDLKAFWVHIEQGEF